MTRALAARTKGEFLKDKTIDLIKRAMSVQHKIAIIKIIGKKSEAKIELIKVISTLVATTPCKIEQKVYGTTGLNVFRRRFIRISRTVAYDKTKSLGFLEMHLEYMQNAVRTEVHLSQISSLNIQFDHGLTWISRHQRNGITR